jgi:hypothetical protein
MDLDRLQPRSLVVGAWTHDLKVPLMDTYVDAKMTANDPTLGLGHGRRMVEKKQRLVKKLLKKNIKHETDLEKKVNRLLASNNQRGAANARSKLVAKLKKKGYGNEAKKRKWKKKKIRSSRK